MKTAFFDFSMEGKIEVRGDGRIAFINGIVSNDIEKLNENQGCYAAFLDKFGKVLSDATVYKHSEHLLLTMNVLGKKNILEKLINEAKLAKSTIEDVSMKQGLFSIIGSNAKQKVEELIGEEIELDEPLSFVTKTINGNNILVIKNQRTNVEGYDIFFPASFYNDFKKLLAKKKIEAGSSELFETLRIEAGKPQFGIDFTSDNILPEVTESATSYDKGCFVGQEIVVRVKNLAKGMTAKRLMQFEINTTEEITKKTKIMKDEKEAGFITSSALSPTKEKTVALGYLKKDLFEENDFLVNNSNTIVTKPKL